MTVQWDSAGWGAATRQDIDAQGNGVTWCRDCHATFAPDDLVRMHRAMPYLYYCAECATYHGAGSGQGYINGVIRQ